LYKSFAVISAFICDLWECEFLNKSSNSAISKIPELKRAHDTIVSILDEHRKPSTKELAEDLYPLLEVSFPWNELKKKGKLPSYFLEHYKSRLKTEENYYGSIFEIKMASFCLFSDYNLDFLEDYADPNKQIDFTLRIGTQSNIFAVECTSRRMTNNLTSKKLIQTIKEKSKKFNSASIKALSGKSKDEIKGYFLVIDITRPDYSTPLVLENLTDLFKKVESSLFDGVTLVWTEDILDGDNHSLRPKSENIGFSVQFTPKVAIEIHFTNDGTVLFMRNYIEPEPKITSWGPEEKTNS